MSHSKTNLSFYKYQRKLVLLWFLWGSVILIFALQKSFFGYFNHSIKPIWTWIGIYLGTVYSLITGSSFFKHKLGNYYLKDIIYFRLAYISSILYLIAISVVIIIMPLYILENGGDREELLRKFADSDTVFKVLLPIQLGLLTYFFFKKEKVE